MKRILLCIVSVLLLHTLSACTIIDHGDQKVEKIAQPIDKTTAKEGYYITDGTDYYALCNYGQGFSTITNVAKSNRVTMWTDGDKLVPVLKKGEDNLVYYSQRERATSYTLEMMEDYGYSIGVYNILYDEEYGMYYMNPKTFCIDSSLGAYIKSFETNRVYLDNINGITDIATYLSRSGSILGLEAGKSYDIGIYAGTVYSDISLLADTRIFASYKIYNLSETTMTQYGYQIIKLPDDLPSGYYVVDGKGMFYYDNPDLEPDYTKFEGEVIISTDIATPTDANGNYYYDGADKDDNLENELFYDDYMPNMPNREGE